MRNLGDLTIVPVLTINSAEEKLITEFRQIAGDSNILLDISLVSGFGRTELRVSEGYLKGNEVIKNFMKYVAEHGNYRPFLEMIV